MAETERFRRPRIGDSGRATRYVLQVFKANVTRHSVCQMQSERREPLVALLAGINLTATTYGRCAVKAPIAVLSRAFSSKLSEGEPSLSRIFKRYLLFPLPSIRGRCVLQLKAFIGLQWTPGSDLTFCPLSRSWTCSHVRRGSSERSFAGDVRNGGWR